jgi:hypothetical protein
MLAMLALATSQTCAPIIVPPPTQARRVPSGDHASDSAMAVSV